MIDIKELRIGNIIEKGGNAQEVDIKTLQEIMEDPAPFAGMKIDEEWLKKFDIPLKENKDYEYWFDSKGSWLVEIVQDECTENNYIAQCFFVHQLQNIYFALTGEELGEEE
ncbi:MAG: hypothetical protein NVSMB45_07430 [Ginsengibacter sp.]